MSNDAALPLAELERIDDLCDRFERRLRAGETPDVAVALEDAPSGREPETLVELLLVEAHFVGEAEADVYVERRLGAFPAFAGRARELLRTGRSKPVVAGSPGKVDSANSPADGRLLDLLSEWNRRRESGDSVSVKELAPQDPELASRLQHAIQNVLRADKFLATRDETFSTRTNDTDGGGAADRETLRPDLTQVNASEISISEALRRLQFAASESAAVRAEVIVRELGSTDGSVLLRRLESEKLLTPFQLERLLGDRPESLSLGAYGLLDSLGEGGMGQVFLARHRAMNRVVAIKLLPPWAVGSPESVSRFRREMQAAARLMHPNIVCAHDAGDSRGQYYLAMEYVEGQDLAARVKRSGAYSTLEALDLVDQAAAGLEFAHARGMVHRDIKPSNLLVDANGTVKIVDFGLARLADSADANGAAELTSTNAMMGTVDFMPPEQAADARKADHRADIYSLGCTLYYLVAGRAPFGGDSIVARVLAHRDGPVPSLRAVDPSIPASLEEAFRRMLAKRPEDRVQSIAEARKQLRAGRDELVARKHPKAANPNGEGRGGRRGLLIGAAAAGFLFALLALTVFLVRTPNGTIVVEVNEPGAEIEVLDGERVEIRRKSDGQKITLSVDPGRKRLKVTKDGFDLFVEEFELGSGDKRQLVARLEPVEAARPTVTAPRPTATSGPQPASPLATPAMPGASVASAFDWAPGPAEDILPGLIPRPAKLPGVKRWQARTLGGPTVAAWHPDGTKIAYGDTSGVVRIEDAKTSRILRSFVAHDHSVRDLQWSPDGQALVSVGDSTPRIWSEEGLLKTELVGHVAGVLAAAWSPDGKRLATGAYWGDSSVRIWNVDGTPGPVIPHTTLVQDVAWSPDGRVLASTDSEAKTILLSDASDGRELGRIGPLATQCITLAWSADSKRLASDGGDWSGAKVGGYVWDVAERKMLAELPKWNTWLIGLFWSAEGKLAATSQDAYLTLYDPDSGELLAHPQVMLKPAPGVVSWSPDGSRIVDAAGRFWAVADDETSFRQVSATGDDRAPLDGPRPSYESVSWSPDGKTFAASGFHGNSDVWSSDGEFLRSFAYPRDHRRFVDWHPTEPRFVTGSGDSHAVEIWNASGALEQALVGHTGGVRCQKWSPDGKRIASGGFDRTVRIWNANGTPGPILEGHEGHVSWVAWSPNGSRIASAGGDGTVRLWSASGDAEATIAAHEGTAHCVEWSPDGTKLASVGFEDGRVRLWDADSHELLAENQAHRSTVDVRWSPDGERLASIGAGDGVLRIWDAKLQPLGAHPLHDEACGVDWTASGDRLALVSYSNVVRMFDAQGKPERILVLSREGDPISFTAAGERVSGNGEALSRVAYLIEDEAGGRTSLSPAEFDAFIVSGKAFDDWRALNRDSKSTFDWTPGPADDVMPGLILRPAKLPGVKRWQIRGTEAEGYVAAWHPDGTRIAYGDMTGVVSIVDVATSRVDRSFIAHDEAVSDLSWNRDGTLLASCGGVAGKIWTAAGELKSTLEGHVGLVRSISWNPEGDRLVTCGHWNDPTVRIWTVDGVAGPTVQGKDFVESAAWSPDGDRIAWTDTSACEIVLSDASDLREIARLGPLPRSPSSVAWNADGTLLATNGGDWEQGVGGYVWKVADRKPVAVLKKENSWINWLGWSSDGKLAATTQDGYVFHYDPANGDVLRQSPSQSSVRLGKASWSPDGTRLSDAAGRTYTVSDDGKSLAVAEPASGERFRPWASAAYGDVKLDCVAWSPKGDRFATVGHECKLQIWTFDGGLETSLTGHSGDRIRCVDWSPDGERIVTGGWGDRTLRIWKLDDETSIELKGHEGAICWVAFSPDGSRVASASNDGTTRIWNLDGTRGPQLLGHEGRVLWADWDFGGMRLATAGQDGTVRIWNAADGSPLQVLRGHEGMVHSVDWHPDGKRLASGGYDDQTLRIWNLENESSVSVAGHDGPILQVAWNPSGERVASLDWVKLRIRVWNDRGESVRSFATPYETSAIDWNSDGSRLIASAYDGTARVWDAEGVPERSLAYRGGDRWMFYSAGGRRFSGSSGGLEAAATYLLESPDGQAALLSPSEFEDFLQSGQSFDEWRKAAPEANAPADAVGSAD